MCSITQVLPITHIVKVCVTKGGQLYCALCGVMVLGGTTYMLGRGWVGEISPSSHPLNMTCILIMFVQLSSQVEVFDTQTELWSQRSTTGTPPNGLYNCAYTAVGKSKCTLFDLLPHPMHPPLPSHSSTCTLFYVLGSYSYFGARNVTLFSPLLLLSCILHCIDIV